MQPVVRVSFYDQVRKQSRDAYDSGRDAREARHEERAVVEVGIAGGQMLEVVVLPDGQYEIALYDSADPQRHSARHLAAGELEGPPRRH